ncbi:MAG: 3-phosphoshikimate 1-carboxyvinyltransferase [Eubacteriales bacterium]
MRVTVRPGVAHGQVAAPPSKSYAHRMLIGAALAAGVSRVRGIIPSEDMLATLDCITALGATYTADGDGTLTVRGLGVPTDSGPRTETAVFPCRESGSTLRFFLPLALAAMPGGGSACFRGTPRLMERGVGVYETLFAKRGIRLEKGTDTLTVTGTLTPGAYTIPGNISSQFATGLLFALPLLDGDSTLCILPPVESRLYIDITVDVLRRFGVRVEETAPNTFSVPGRQTYRPADVTVEGDWSNGAFLYALNTVGGQVEVTGLSRDSLQGDRICLSCFRRLTGQETVPGQETAPETGEPTGAIDISSCPDLGPVLFTVAAASGRGAAFTGTRRLRIKESDRAAAMAGELARFGAQVEVEENRVLLHPAALHPPDGILCGHNDHRVVMALSVLAARYGGVIDGAEAVKKSYPDFFSVLERLGLEVAYDT